MQSYKLTKSGLVRRRERLAGDIIIKRRELVALRRDLDALDKTLILFGYKEPASIKPIVAYRRLFKRGQLTRLIQDITRDKPSITDNAGFTEEVIKRMEWTRTDELYESVFAKVRHARWAHKRRETRLMLFSGET